MIDRRKVVKGLEEISDYFFSVYHHSKDREEINNAKDRCDAVEDALSLLKEQEVTERISDAIHETAKQFRQTIVRCKDCKYNDDGECIIKAGWFPVTEDWYCADGERAVK